MKLSPTISKNERVFTKMVLMGRKIHAGGNVNIKVNDQLGSYFQTRKSLR
jgi:hypothetical protein